MKKHLLAIYYSDVMVCYLYCHLLKTTSVVYPLKTSDGNTLNFAFLCLFVWTFKGLGSHWKPG